MGFAVGATRQNSGARRVAIRERGGSREPCAAEKGTGRLMPTSELFLKDVIDIKEDVHADDFKIELSEGFSESDARVAE